MRRREFVQLAAGTAMAWPLAGHAQQPEHTRRIGVLIAFPENDPFAQAIVTAFAQALGRFGRIEGKNIRTDYRFAAGDPALFKTYAAELVGLSPDAILATTPPAVAALREQTRIPIVFVLVVDPVGLGFVQSLARPGGNITGFSAYDAPMMGKWLQLLKEVAPSVTRVAVIFNPDTAPHAPLFNRAIQAAASSFGIISKSIAGRSRPCGRRRRAACECAERAGEIRFTTRSKNPRRLDGLDRGSQVRSRLAAGGRWIRTLGPPSEGLWKPSFSLGSARVFSREE
jgi:ABC-type uncharacterized transport system substrate-binding protein